MKFPGTPVLSQRAGPDCLKSQVDHPSNGTLIEAAFAPESGSSVSG